MLCCCHYSGGSAAVSGASQAWLGQIERLLEPHRANFLARRPQFSAKTNKKLECSRLSYFTGFFW
jgi:hypothetical protein